MSESQRIGKRVNLTLRAETLIPLQKLAEAGGVPVATMLRQMIEMAVLSGQVQQMTDALRLAAEGDTNAFRVLKRAVQDVQKESGQLSLSIDKTRRRVRTLRRSPNTGKPSA